MSKTKLGKPKHTPGPWKILKGHTGWTWFVIYKTLETRQRAEAASVYKGPRLVSADGVTYHNAVASVDALDLSYTANLDANKAEAEANARLISAAPELLEECKFALRCLEAAASAMGEENMYSDSREGLRAAIAKAEGGAK